MSELKRRTQKKREARMRAINHQIMQRLKDVAQHPNYALRYEGRWRFMPEKPFEYTLSSYPQLVAVCAHWEGYA